MAPKTSGSVAPSPIPSPYHSGSLMSPPVQNRSRPGLIFAWYSASQAPKSLGPNGRLASGFLPAHGFTAILIALVAQLTIVGTAVSALFFGALASAALYRPVMAGMPAAAIEVINATIALFITSRAKWLDKLLTRKPA